MNISDVLVSSDGITRKYVQVTADNCRVETSYVDYPNKHIICFSTQVGCNLGCRFCYNGVKRNFIRNLSYCEIYTQIMNVLEREYRDTSKPLLFSAMGIGEPLLNYENLISVFKRLSKEYPNSKVALATTGVLPNYITKLADDLEGLNFKLTISLHSAIQSIRDSIMPICSDIDILVKTVKEYESLTKNKVEWNYVLFDGVNDSIEDALALHNLLGSTEYIKINKYNYVPISELSESTRKEEFIRELRELNMQVEYYETNGDDINGACGQMISE